MGFLGDFADSFIDTIEYVPKQLYNKILTPVGNKLGDVVDTVDNAANNLTRGAGDALSGAGRGLAGLGSGLGNLGEFIPLMLIGGGLLAVVMILKN